MTTRRLCLLMALVAAALALLVWFYPSNSDFKTENPSWNGARYFVDDFQALPLNSLDTVPATGSTTLLVIPYMEFSSADLTKLEDYVNSGGKLIILDDYGFGNEILEHLGLAARFTGSQLLDPLLCYKNEYLPRIIDFAPGPAVSQVEGLTFNHATSLENVPRDNVVARSSYFSFLDESENGKWDEGEVKGPLPVIASFQMGEGELMLIADPSMIISSMLEVGSNQQFLKNIARGQVFLDQSHIPDVSLDEAKARLKTTRGIMATIWGTLGLIMLILASTLGLQKIKSQK